MYFQGMFNLDEASEEADYVVFDDLIGGFEMFRQYKQWLGGQHEFTVSDKYKRKRKFVWGKPCIMLMNEDPLASPHVDIDWLCGNTIIHCIHNSFVTITD